MLDRRTILKLSGALMVASNFAVRDIAAASDTTLPLWSKTPGFGGPTGPVQISERGAVSNIAMPSIEVFHAARPNGAAMLVAAGGGYKRIEVGTEARPAAQWLAARGITAFILQYRLPAEGWDAGPLAPLQDAQRALRLIRANAARFRIDTNRVGVLGFSSGGHLMGMAAARSAFTSYQSADEIDRQSARPVEAALIYPVITLEPPYDHTSTRQVLVGRHPSESQSAEWSVESHVKSGCPPMFLVQAKDDPISDPSNTVIMADACRRAGVPVELHQLPSGGHGFGMGSADSPTGEWPGWYVTWLKGRGMLS
jgi:acetyl esterase/lipase